LALFHNIRESGTLHVDNASLLQYMTYVNTWPKKIDLRDVDLRDADCAVSNRWRGVVLVLELTADDCSSCVPMFKSKRAHLGLKILNLSLEQKEGADIFPNACIDCPRHVRIMSFSAFDSYSAFPTMRRWVFSDMWLSFIPLSIVFSRINFEIVTVNVQRCRGNSRMPT